ncbi:hypothetical protein SDC9_167239 [bioreactor metagenome]|uniref:Uncharacterized protein n=1 Tax=bioreactor metagenome TaxID=1076179 RepID=A0A645G6Y2_9ZZZZ
MELFTHIIYALAFEENDRIGSGECGAHKSFCVIRSSGEAYLQSGDMSGERCPVLRMLCAVFASYRNAENDRHLKNPSTH